MILIEVELYRARIFNKAWMIAKSLKCRHAYVYAMGQEPWYELCNGAELCSDSIQMTESDKFVAKCRENSIESRDSRQKRMDCEQLI